MAEFSRQLKLESVELQLAPAELDQMEIVLNFFCRDCKDAPSQARTFAEDVRRQLKAARLVPR